MRKIKIAMNEIKAYFFSTTTSQKQYSIISVEIICSFLFVLFEQMPKMWKFDTVWLISAKKMHTVKLITIKH